MIKIYIEQIIKICKYFIIEKKKSIRLKDKEKQ